MKAIARLDIVRERDVFTRRAVPVTATRLLLSEPARAHVHEFLELAFIVDGGALHVSEAGTTLLRQGHVVVIAAGAWHGYRPDPDLTVVSVRVGIGILRRVLPWVGTLPGIGYLFDVEEPSPRPSILVTEISPATARAIRPAISALTDPPRAGHADLFSRVARLLDVLGGLDELWSDAAWQVDDMSARPDVEAALRLLRARIAEPWSLGRLADEVHLSRSQLVRLFGASVGMSPMAYLRELRALRMAELLRWTDLSVTEAARSAGWSDPNYASRCFHSRWGMSPSRFRSLSGHRPKAS